MKIVIDASALLAVVLDEPERESIIEATTGATLVAPGALPFEISNALIALYKRSRLRAEEVISAWEASKTIPVRLVDVGISAALRTALEIDSYAYDAFYLQCALAQRRPLLTLDRKMRRAAQDLGIQLPV